MAAKDDEYERDVRRNFRRVQTHALARVLAPAMPGATHWDVARRAHGITLEIDKLLDGES